MKVEFLPGIASISGSIKPSKGKRIIFRHFASDLPGQGHVTICAPDAYRRKTPVSERELAAKRLFSRRASYVKLLRNRHPDISHVEAWRLAKAHILCPDRPPESIFLHGKPLFKKINEHLPMVQVDIPDRPEGRYPVCTRANAEKYGITIYKNF
jgi:hypothetical protein